MRATKIGIWSLLLVMICSASSLMAQDERYEATAVIEVKTLLDTEESKLQALCDESLDLSIDYSCVDAGVIVFKLYNSTYNDPADARMYIQNKIADILEKKRVTFLHTSTRKLQGVSKC